MPDENTSESTSKDPLSAAQAIVNALTPLEEEDRLLAIHFAKATLRLPADARTSQPAVTSNAQTNYNEDAQQPSSHIMHVDQAADSSSNSDIRTFTNEKKPQSDQQFCAVAAYYYSIVARGENRRDSVNADIMKEAARQAGRPQVQRWNMTLTNAKNAGYLDAVGDGEYKINAVGENLVAISLPGKATGDTGSRRVSKKKSASKKAKKSSASKAISKKISKKSATTKKASN